MCRLQNILFTKKKNFPSAHILYRLSKCTLHFFIQLEVYNHMRIFQHITRSRRFPDVSFFNHVNHLNFKINKKIGLSK